jgi:hypothetical protein
MTFSMINMIFSLFSWCILSCTVLLHRAVRPPAIPFRVVFCNGVGWCMKSSIYGVTQHDAPESIMGCDVCGTCVCCDQNCYFEKLVMLQV